MITLFTGFDRRESAGWHVFAQSVLERCSQPVAIRPLTHMPGMPEGSNAFTFTRFLIPYLMDWQGTAIFVDGVDMLCREDLAELEALRNPHMAVQVVKHDYRTRHPMKYVGSSMECENRDYPRKNWASVMLINCGNIAWRKVRPHTLAGYTPLDLLGLRFIDDERIGDLPPEWNWLADEHGEWDGAKLLHWTAGVPEFEAYKTSAHAAEWFAARESANGLG
jgi:hypothetical protein